MTGRCLFPRDTECIIYLLVPGQDHTNAAPVRTAGGRPAQASGGVLTQSPGAKTIVAGDDRDSLCSTASM